MKAKWLFENFLGEVCPYNQRGFSFPEFWSQKYVPSFRNQKSLLLCRFTFRNDPLNGVYKLFRLLEIEIVSCRSSQLSRVKNLESCFRIILKSQFLGWARSNLFEVFHRRNASSWNFLLKVPRSHQKSNSSRITLFESL